MLCRQMLLLFGISCVCFESLFWFGFFFLSLHGACAVGNASPCAVTDILYQGNFWEGILGGESYFLPVILVIRDYSY